MTEINEKLPLDARLLSESIHELNIARRNVSIYPKEHPIVEKSLSKSYECFVELFELRNEITLSVAKDTLIVDDYYLDKAHPVFRDFALCLTDLNIAFITFQTGLSRNEVYDLLRYIVENDKSSSETLMDRLNKYELPHVTLGFIDYGAFAFDDGGTDYSQSEDLIWERYVSGMKEGRLQTGDETSRVRDISPEKLAGLLNRTDIETVKEESYDRAITAYMRSSSDRALSGNDLRKIMDFINSLRPELKKQFLTTALREVAVDIDDAENALEDISGEEALNILKTINKQKVAIPETLRNLLDKFSKLEQQDYKSNTLDDAHIADDIVLSTDIMNLLSDGGFEKYVSSTYQKEIQKLLDLESQKKADVQLHEFSDEYIENTSNETLLYLISTEMPDIISKDEDDIFMRLLKEQIEKFLETGQYQRVLKILKTVRENIDQDTLPGINRVAAEYVHSPQFIAGVVDSFTIMGRSMKEDVYQLIDYYGLEIVSPFMDALIDEQSATTRRFLISLITRFGEHAVPETLKRLDDSQWFVQRNMLVILEECGNTEAFNHIKPFCLNKNPKVSLQAIKCLLKAGDNVHAVEALRKHLMGNTRETVNSAVVLAGSYKITEAVPELISLLKKKALTSIDYKDKIPVVRALGMIGDHRALDPLGEIMGSKSILFKKAFNSLKAEIFATLSNYSQNEIKDIV